MLIGFESITKPLTGQEKKVVSLFVNGLIKCEGVEKAVTSEKLIQKAATKKGIFLTGSRVRKIINHIRLSGRIDGLVASSKGYYTSNDPAVLRGYIASLKGRENEIRKVRRSIEDHLRFVEGY